MTAIEWTDETWNPTVGCSRVSEGCRHCYAEQQAARIVRMSKGKSTAYDGLVRFRSRVSGLDYNVPGAAGTSDARWTGIVRLIPDRLTIPMKWKTGRRIFVNSMSDLFHESLTNEQIAAVFGVMAACPQHTFQILTKRARRMREWLEWLDHAAMLGAPGDQNNNWWRVNLCLQYAALEIGYALKGAGGQLWPLPNVWLGVSVENQAAADERIPELLETPAEKRFLSCEPLLGPVDISEYFDPCSVPCGEEPWPELDWVIAGCESGTGARLCDVGWLRSLRDQCAQAGVPYFLKQATRAIAPGTADARGNVLTPAREVVTAGPGSKRKPNNVISLPYLDGFQHKELPQ